MAKQQLLTAARKRAYSLDAKTIAYYRRNPCIAAEDLLGVRLLDAQKYILQNTWNASHACWCCSRNFGKSFVGAVFLILKAVLYENQALYIVSSVGDQAKETFTKIEELVLRTGKTSASFKDLKDIVEHETVKSPTNRTGFSHPAVGYEVHFYNGSAIYTLNSNPDNNRSRRATVVFFDEASYCSAELISVCEAFATQSSDFVTSTDSSYDPELEPPSVPTQLVYASSQGAVDAMFYAHYKSFAKQMLAGNRDYFCCDMTCEVAIKTYLNGKPYLPLLTQDKVDAALKSDRDKALREYYNAPMLDAGAGAIVRRSTILRNEHFYLPVLERQPGRSYALAMDPARSGDNSIISVMEEYEDPALGLCGNICNCVNLVDTASRKHYKLDSTRQVAELRAMLLRYGGKADYEFIDTVLIDAGAGGGGVSAYSDALLQDWTDSNGREHRGLIDRDYELYRDGGYEDLYPDAVDKLQLVNPRKYRTQMVEEFIELMELGVLRFSYEYDNREYITMVRPGSKGEEVLEDYPLSAEEQLALAQLELMKTEILAIRKTSNAEGTSVQYALAKEKANTLHDDRFYTAILLAHRLYEKRRGSALLQEPEELMQAGPGICVSSIHF